MSWHWRLEDPSGSTLDPASVGVEIPACDNQSDAESWLGENWRELLDKGVSLPSERVLLDELDYARHPALHEGIAPHFGALVSVAGAVVVGDDGDDGSSSSSTGEDDEALVSALIVVSCDVSVPPTSAATGFCPMSSMPVMTPMAMTNTAAA